MERDERDETGAGRDEAARRPESDETPAGRTRASRGARRTDRGDDPAGEQHTTADAEHERRVRAERFQAEHPDLVERGRRTEGERLIDEG